MSEAEELRPYFKRGLALRCCVLLSINRFMDSRQRDEGFSSIRGACRNLQGEALALYLLSHLLLRD
jgi:hypothetical protein